MRFAVSQRFRGDFLSLNVEVLGAYPALGVNALPLDRGGLPDRPGAPQLGPDLGVGDAH